MNFCGLISGGGTTMEQFLLSCRDGDLSGLIKPVLVIASNEGIDGIRKAQDVGLPDLEVIVCNRGCDSREKYGKRLLSLLRGHRVELVGQLGWLPLTPISVIRAFDGMIWNQHPAPLDTGYPDFGGKGMHGRRAHCARLFFSRTSGRDEDQFTEATAHLVTEEFDKGAVIGRTRIKIEPEDDVVSLAGRVLPEEHKLQIEIGRQFATGTVATQPRETRLIQPSQEALLDEAKRVAGLLFPKG
jgi:folate-dependent phosphoribosylglycinamide formyltransferase PurN